MRVTLWSQVGAVTVVVGTALLCGAVPAGEAAVTFATKPSVAKTGGGARISFALSAKGDAEVAVLDAKGQVVRHLAAGVLGGETPPPAPLKAGLSQSLEWDGKDDYGEAAKNGPFSVRVRAGMGVKLEKIVGGDPYAYFSKEMGYGDHATWHITGLDAKPNGRVYIMGNACDIGPGTLREYDAEGNYRKTVFPPPAGLPVDEVKGWGIVTKPDGTYAFQYCDMNSPKLSKTLIYGKRAFIAQLLPCRQAQKLLIMNDARGFEQMKINTDGSIPADAMAAGTLVKQPSMVSGEKGQGVTWELVGNVYTCPSPDGKHFYLSGIFAGTIEKARCLGAEKTGFWRDGQLFKVDAATGEAKVFFSLPEETVIGPIAERDKSPIAHDRTVTCAALHGVATNADGNVFLCDRLNKRVVVLDRNAKVIREIPIDYPDAVAVSPKSKALYVTTRFGNYHKSGELKLLRFGDWTKDNKPLDVLPLCSAGKYPHRSHLAAIEANGKVLVWAAYTVLPVRVYEDDGKGLVLVKDFYEAGPQRCLDVHHMIVDPKTEDAYFAGSFQETFRIRNWQDPKFERCLIGEKQTLRALSFAIDTRNRLLYTQNYMRADVKHSLYRHHLDREYIEPAPIGGADTHAISGQYRVGNDWRIGYGQSNRGIAASPDGSLAALGATAHTDYSGPLHYFARNDKAVPWEPMQFTCLGPRPATGGIRFDPAGNLYVGIYRSGKNGAIIKFTPTGTLAAGNLYPTPPAKPSRAYEDIDYAFPDTRDFPRTCRFGVDGYGRISYPTVLEPRVTLIDNEGNEILRFGTWGNRDSMGGLEGDLVPTKDIPLAWPNSVDATDDYVYVSDMINIRVLRLKKTFAAAETVEIK